MNFETNLAAQFDRITRMNPCLLDAVLPAPIERRPGQVVVAFRGKRADRERGWGERTSCARRRPKFEMIFGGSDRQCLEHCLGIVLDCAQ